MIDNPMPECFNDDGDLQRHAGKEIPDPWNDDVQTDWPNNIQAEYTVLEEDAVSWRWWYQH